MFVFSPTEFEFLLIAMLVDRLEQFFARTFHSSFHTAWYQLAKIFQMTKVFFVWPNKLNDERNVENLKHFIPPKLCTLQQKIKMLTTDDKCHIMAITHKTLYVVRKSLKKIVQIPAYKEMSIFSNSHFEDVGCCCWIYFWMGTAVYGLIGPRRRLKCEKLMTI